MKRFTNIPDILLFCSLWIFFGFSSCSKKDDPNIVPEVIEEASLDESISAIIPEIKIAIAGNQEVIEKDVYLNATVQIDGKGVFPNLAAVSTKIKGRGNSTWNKPKKPYRLKLDAKSSVLGLGAAKDWVLLANYQDYTLMCNAIAMKIGQQLGLPFTNTVIPVDLIVNGTYRGSYMLTQQVEVKENRVDIGDNGVLLELDVNYDEDFQFKSKGLNLPVMIKNPDIKTQDQFTKIKDDFESLESLLMGSSVSSSELGRLLDKKQLVNYLLVNNLVANFEINHPKSVYMYQPVGGKYMMGPIWDFDWAFGMDEDSRLYFNYVTVPLLRDEDPRLGSVFLRSFLKDADVRSLYKETWANYKKNKLDELLKYIDEYAARIRESQKKDYEVWKVGDNKLPQYKADLKVFIRKRANYLDSYFASL